jgi:hypothetical protein
MNEGDRALAIRQSYAARDLLAMALEAFAEGDNPKGEAKIYAAHAGLHGLVELFDATERRVTTGSLDYLDG